jgi:hypothetical protein
MRRQVLSLAVVLFVSGLIAPATSYAQQAVNFYLGGFVPKGADSRTDNDVLVGNLERGGLLFDVGDFHSVTVGGEWLFGLGQRFDAGAGLGFYSKSVPSIYSDLTHSNGDEIEQDLKLRVVPFTATVRFLPLGRGAGVEPYIGAGVGVFAWRYSETGEFVDTDGIIFRDSFSGTGAAAGPLVLGGVGFPLGSWSIGFEGRYQWAQGDLPTDQGFWGTKIDLGGFTYLFSFKVRF